MWLGNFIIDLIDRIRRFQKPTIAMLFVLVGLFLLLNLRVREEKISDFSVKVQGWPWVYALEHADQEKQNGNILDADTSNYINELTYARKVYGLDSTSIISFR